MNAHLNQPIHIIRPPWNALFPKSTVTSNVHAHLNCGSQGEIVQEAWYPDSFNQLPTDSTPFKIVLSQNFAEPEQLETGIRCNERWRTFLKRIQAKGPPYAPNSPNSRLINLINQASDRL